MIYPNAAIDIGTNTIRLLIGDVENNNLIRLHSEREVTRLGRDLTKTGILNKQGIDNSMSCLLKFKELLDQFKVRQMVAVGTSALRDAANSRDFIAAVKAQIGVDIIIISGDREAELTVKGVLGYEHSPNIPAFITDIGGGSTEWILLSGNPALVSCAVKDTYIIQDSIQIGGVRLFEQFIRNDPPDPDEMDDIINKIFQLVETSFRTKGLSSRIDKSNIRSFIATGGTATTVAAIDMGLDTYVAERVHLHTMSFYALKQLLKHLSSMPLCERTHLKGLEAGKADIVIPGILILATLMEILKADTLTVSDYGLLEGILLDVGHIDL